MALLIYKHFCIQWGLQWRCGSIYTAQCLSVFCSSVFKKQFGCIQPVCQVHHTAGIPYIHPKETFHIWLNVTQLCLYSDDKILLEFMHFKKLLLWSVSKLCDVVTAQSKHTYLSCGGTILFFAWRSRVQSYKLSFPLENLGLQELNDLQTWNKTHLGNGQISRGTVREVIRTCVTQTEVQPSHRREANSPNPTEELLYSSDLTSQL